MPSAVTRFRSTNPDADYREVVTALIALARSAGWNEAAAAVERAVAVQVMPDTETPFDPLVDYGGVTVENIMSDMSTTAAPLAIRCVMELICLPILTTSGDGESQTVVRSGRELIVALHPVDPTFDLSNFILLSALVEAVGDRIELPGCVWAVTVPGTAWAAVLPAAAPSTVLGVNSTLEAPSSEALAGRVQLIEAVADAIASTE